MTGVRLRVSLVGFVFLGLAMSVLASCALLRKSDPLTVRYFSAEAQVAPPNAERAQHSAAPLRLGKVQAASHIQQRLVFRKDRVEVGYYDGLRWTDPPEHYLQRMLTNLLFEQGRFARVVSGPATTLEATLLTFEEMRGSPHLARAAVAITLYDDRMSRLERTFSVDVEVSGNASSDGEEDEQHASALANALTTALMRAAEQIAAEVQQAVPAVGEVQQAPPVATADPTGG